MGGLNQNSPAIMGTRQGPWTPICERQMTRTTHHAMTHRWEPAQAGFVTIMEMCLYMCASVFVCVQAL